MAWYNTEGALPHHVIHSQTKYIRNFQSIPFSNRADKAQIDSIKPRLEKLLEKNGFKKESLERNDLYQFLSFAEKGFCDADTSLLQNSASSSQGLKISDLSLYFNDPCSLAVSVGGRDLLVIRSLLSGRAIKETQSIALEAEELFDREFEFAYSERIGYLSPDVYKCGSGEFFSALLYLPASRAEAFEEIKALAFANQTSISPFYRDRENSGDMYVVTHSPSHLSDRFHAASGFDILISDIVEKEKTAEGIFFAENGKLIIEKAYRAYGTLMYARQISEEEMLSLISSIRLCLATAPESFSHLSANTVNLILSECMNFSVMSSYPECGSYEELDESRALLIRKILDNSAKAQ